MDGINTGRYRSSCGYGCEIEKLCHAELGEFALWAGSEMSRSPQN